MAGPESTFHCWSLINSSVLVTTASLGHAVTVTATIFLELGTDLNAEWAAVWVNTERGGVRYVETPSCSLTEPSAPEFKAFTARGGHLESKSSKWSFLPVLCSCSTHSTGAACTAVSLQEIHRGSKALYLHKSWVFLCKPEFYSSCVHTNFQFIF